MQEQILYKKVIESIVDSLKKHMKNFEIKFSEDKNDFGIILSKSIFSGIQQDILFNNWNIKHIHLNKKEANSKEEMGENRGDFLLFCIIIEKYVFFLDVREHPHGAGFTSYSFLEIISNNGWMQYIGFSELNDIIDITFKVTNDSDIYKLYNAHVNIIFKLGNKFFIHVNGVRSSGDKGKNVDRASEIILHIKNKCDNFPDDTEYKVNFLEEKNLFSVQLNNQCFSFQI